MDSDRQTFATDRAWDAIRDALDMHVHVSPDVIQRSTDDLGLARDFLARGLKGFVLKSHYVPTAERAHVVQRAVPGIKCFGSITLNHSVGGFNPIAVEIAGRSGAKLVWMPTVDAANETGGRAGGSSVPAPFWAAIQRELAEEHIAPPALSPLDEQGRITPAVRSCFERIGKHGMVLATGHLGRDEIFAAARAALEVGVRKIVVTHAEFPSQRLTGSDQRALAEMGAFIEHCFTTTYTNKADWDVMFNNVRQTGIEHTILSSDLGQTTNPNVTDGLAMYAQRFLDAGFTVDEIRHMLVTTPAQLLE